LKNLQTSAAGATWPPFLFMAIKHFLQFSDFSLDEFEYVIERARIIKRKFKNYETYHPLLDRTLVMVFEKNSTRTRLSAAVNRWKMRRK
jgi:ornithine carbamoyltransferase